MEEKYMKLTYSPRETRQQIKYDLACAKSLLDACEFIVKLKSGNCDSNSVEKFLDTFQFLKAKGILLNDDLAQKVSNQLDDLGMLLDYVKYRGWDTEPGPIKKIFRKPIDAWNYQVEGGRIYGKFQRLTNRADELKEQRKEKKFLEVETE